MIAEFETRILALIDDMVDHASDDELFASGYLRGHLTLAVAEVEQQNEHTPEALQVHEHTPEALQVHVQNSLQNAIAAGELSPRDQALVIGMWDNLFLQARRQA